MAMQNHHQQNQSQRVSLQTSATGAIVTKHFTNTAKLPIETVKSLIASVSRRPNLWIRTSNSQKRSDVNALWQQVSLEVHLPADICRIKWGHLRDNFRKVFIRNTLSAEPPTTWRFYNDMRFMEAAVAENVMRHHRLREQSLYWQKLHSSKQLQVSTSLTAIQDTYDHSLQNQYNFSEMPAFFQNHGCINKRIKIETSESEPSLHDSTKVKPILFSDSNAFNKSNIHRHNFGVNGAENNDDDEDDDDQFDEDAISLEDSFQNNKSMTNNNDNIGLENNNQSTKAMNTETYINVNLNEQDSDRMFLLSLLPYLRKVKEQRKLQVRQKLQDVLIQEFG